MKDNFDVNKIQEIVKQIVDNSKDQDKANRLLAELNEAINLQYSILYARHFNAAVNKMIEEFKRPFND